MKNVYRYILTLLSPHEVLQGKDHQHFHFTDKTPKEERARDIPKWLSGRHSHVCLAPKAKSLTMRNAIRNATFPSSWVINSARNLLGSAPVSLPKQPLRAQRSAKSSSLFSVVTLPWEGGSDQGPRLSFDGGFSRGQSIRGLPRGPRGCWLQVPRDCKASR